MMMGNRALEDSTRMADVQPIREIVVVPNWFGRCFSAAPRRQNSTAPIRLASAAR
ncbi:hypothetical protein D3C80_1891530 [compost metagenome]